MSRPEFLSLVRYRVNQMLDAGFNRYLVQVFRDLSTEPPVDAIGGGVDLFIVLREAGIAKFGHRRLPFYPTIGLEPRENKTSGSIHEPLHFGCGTAG